jgi:hypothetical protein
MSREINLAIVHAALVLLADIGWDKAFRNRAAALAIMRHMIRKGVELPDEEQAAEDMKWAISNMARSWLRWKR